MSSRPPNTSAPPSARRAARELVVGFEDATGSLLICEDLAFAVWRDAPNADHIRRWHRFALEHGRSKHAPLGCIDIIVAGTPRFSDDMRRETEGFAKDLKVFPRGMAHVVELKGFAGTAVRAFIGTVLLLTRPPTPAKVFGDLDAAATWMRPLLSPGWSVADIVALGRAAADRRPPPA